MSEKPLVTVTGASGFIALHTVRALLEKGYRVRGTLRSLSKEVRVRDALDVGDDGQARLTLVETNLNEDKGWAKAAEGARFLMHIASPVLNAPPKDPDDVIRPAVEGTRRVLRAARHAEVERVVVTSSIAAMIHCDKRAREEVLDESDWSDPNRKGIPTYEKSKTLAERAAWEVAQEIDLDLVTLNPGYVLGPSLLGVDNTSNELVGKLLRREVPGVPQIFLNLVDVRDVADAHLRAIEVPEAGGQRFILVSDACWFRELAAEVKRQGYDVPTLQLPNFAVRLVALWDRTVALILPELGLHTQTNNAQARSVLGWTGRSMSEMVEEAARGSAERARRH